MDCPRLTRPRYSQVLIIGRTLKALDLLLKQSLLGSVVFYTQKTPIQTLVDIHFEREAFSGEIIWGDYQRC
jgi:hypothetical protein